MNMMIMMIMYININRHKSKLCLAASIRSIILSDLSANDLLIPQNTHTHTKCLRGGNSGGGKQGGRGWKQALTVSRELSVQIPERRKRSEE